MWVMKCRLCPITSLLIEFQPLCQDLCNILISRIMEQLGLKNGTRFIPDIIMYGPCNILTMVELWYTQDPDMIKLWCTQDPYKDQYARFLHG